MSDHNAVTPSLTLEEALSEMHGWERVLAGEQGAERGFKVAIEALREASGAAFAQGEDREANALRAHARLLEGSPRLPELREKADEAYRRYAASRELALSLEEAAVPS